MCIRDSISSTHTHTHTHIYMYISSSTRSYMFIFSLIFFSRFHWFTDKTSAFATDFQWRNTVSAEILTFYYQYTVYCICVILDLTNSGPVIVVYRIPDRIDANPRAVRSDCKFWSRLTGILFVFNKHNILPFCYVLKVGQIMGVARRRGFGVHTTSLKQEKRLWFTFSNVENNKTMQQWYANLFTK